MPAGLDISSFREHAINDGTVYKSMFVVEEGATFDTPATTTIESEVPNDFPSFVRSQPDGLRFSVVIEVMTLSQATLDQLKQWLDPTLPPAYLVANSNYGVSTTDVRRILCTVEKLTATDVNLFKLVLRASTGVWEAETETYASVTVAATNQVVALTNAGTFKTPLKLKLTPISQMASADSLIYRRRVSLGWRSEIPANDPIGDGYAIDIGTDSFDTDALTTAKMKANGDDLRIYQAGQELYRWLDGMDTTTTKVWCNLRCAAMRKMLLAAAMSSGSSPAAGTTFAVSNPEGTSGFPKDCFILVGTESIHVLVYSQTEFLVVARGALGTTAASHNASDPAYLVEHAYLNIMYGWSGAAAPSLPDDRKPLIDLALSTNLYHVWNSAWLVPSGTRRSMGWFPTYSDDGPTSVNLRQYESSNTFIFADALAVTGKPNFNNLERDFCVPIKAANGALELDVTINENMLLHCYLLDMEGNESKIFAYGPNGGLTNQPSNLASAANHVRFNGRIGCIIGDYSRDTALQLTSYDVTIHNYHGIRLVLDQTTEIDGIVLGLGKGGGAPDDLIIGLYEDNSDAPADLGIATLGTMPNSSIPVDSTSPLLKVHILDIQPVITVPAGTYWIVLIRQSATGFWYMDTTQQRHSPRIYARQNGTTLHGVTPYVALLSKKTTAQVDAALESGDLITIDNVELTLDDTTPRTPLIVRGAEENMYLFDNRITNVRNWILNSGFESNTTGHAATGTSTIARSLLEAHEGIASLLCTYQNSTTLDDYALTLPTANQSYTFSCWVWIPTNWDGGQIQLAIANYAGSATVSSDFADITRLGQWQRVFLTFSVASDIIGNLQVKTASAPTAGRFIYIDDLQLEPGIAVEGAGFFDTDGDVGGEGIDLYFPCALNKVIEVDSGQRFVFDGELGQPIPFALTPSNPAEWLELAPGFNTIKYVEVGVTGLTLETSFRAMWL